MRTKLDIITNIQLVLWVMILGLCGGIEFLHGWYILLNVLMMLLTGAIIFLLSTLKGVMKHEYKRKRALEKSPNLARKLRTNPNVIISYMAC